MRRLAWLSIALLFVLLLCHQWYGPDIWYHLYLGGRVALTGSAQPTDHLILQQPGYLNFYWLFQLLVRGVFALGGIVGVSALFMVFWAMALGIWLKTSGLRQAGAWGLVAALAAVLICQTRFEQRPEILSYVFLAWQIQWLARWGSKGKPSAWEYARFVAVQVAWTNVHGYFVFGPVLVGVRWVAEVVAGNGGIKPRATRSAPGSTIGGLGLLLGLTLLASVASPFGWRVWREVALQGQFLQAMRFSIQEFLPPTRVPARVLGIMVFEGYWVALAAGTVWVAATSARKHAFALLLAAGGLGLSAYAMRNLPLGVFLAAPLVGVLLPQLERVRLPERFIGWAVSGAALGLSIWVLSNGFYRSTGGVPGFGIRESEYACPIGFNQYLDKSGFNGRLFNDPGDGGYLEFHRPELPLYGDTRFVDARLIRGYFIANVDPVILHRLQKTEGFDGVLVRVTESPYVVTAWLEDADWRLAYADLHRAFFINRRSAAGGQTEAQAPRFYRGEDLTVPVNGASASNWVGALIQAEDRQYLVRALKQFSAAPRIPAELVELALQYGRGRGDREVFALGAAMRPRMIAGDAKAVAAVDGMLAR